MDLTEAEDIKKRWQEHTELYKKDLHDPDNHDDVIDRAGLPAGQVLAALTMLELKGAITRLPGKRVVKK